MLESDGQNQRKERKKKTTMSEEVKLQRKMCARAKQGPELSAQSFRVSAVSSDPKAKAASDIYSGPCGSTFNYKSLGPRRSVLASFLFFPFFILTLSDIPSIMNEGM